MRVSFSVNDTLLLPTAARERVRTLVDFLETSSLSRGGRDRITSLSTTADRGTGSGEPDQSRQRRVLVFQGVGGERKPSVL